MVVPRLKVEPEAMSDVRVEIAQLSVAAGSLKVTTASHVPGSVDTVMSDMAGITGSSVSVTTTLKLMVAVLFAASMEV